MQLEALGQCLPPPRHVRLTSVAIPKFNQLFTDPLPTFPENFMQIRSKVFAQSC